MSNEGVRGGNVMKNESDINYVKAAKISIRFSSYLQRVKGFLMMQFVKTNLNSKQFRPFAK